MRTIVTCILGKQAPVTRHMVNSKGMKHCLRLIPGGFTAIDEAFYDALEVVEKNVTVS